MNFKYISNIVTAAIIVFLAATSGYSAASQVERDLTPVRIGWQVPSSTQGQIVQVLKRTDVLEQHGLIPTFIPYSYGKPQIAAALGGKLDVVFSGDQPAINLVSASGTWKIVGRMNYDRVAMMVPVGSPIAGFEDLRGKTVASSFGSIAHREAFLWQQAAGLDPNQDVKNVNMDILDIQDLVTAGGGEKWGDIDAVVVWETSTSLFELGKLARALDASPTIGVISFSEEFMSERPEAAARLLVAISQSWEYFSQHSERVRQWYIDDSQLGYTPASLDSAARFDTNFGVQSVGDVSLRLTEKNVATLEQGVIWKQEQERSSVRMPMRDFVDQATLVSAMTYIESSQLEVLKVIMPSAREISLSETNKKSPLDAIPPWAFFLLMVLITILAMECGQALGRRRRRLIGEESEGAIGTVVGAILALLAFVIALTFGSAIGRYDASREALLDDVTALRTAYQRAGLVQEPYRTETRVLLRDYIEIRIGMADVYGDQEKLQSLQVRAKTLQELLWSEAEVLAAIDQNDIHALFSEGLTEVFRMQTRRVAYGAQFRIPTFVWVIVTLVSIISMIVVGLQFGMSGRRSAPAQLGLALTFALVIQLIYDLDRPGQGVIGLNQQPMIDLFQSLGTQD